MRTVRQRVQMITMGTATMSVEPAICMQVVRFVFWSSTDPERQGACRCALCCLFEHLAADWLNLPRGDKAHHLCIRPSYIRLTQPDICSQHQQQGNDPKCCLRIHVPADAIARIAA